MPNNDEAHRALDRIGVKKGPLPERVMEVVAIVEDLRVKVRQLTPVILPTEPTEPLTEQQKASYLYPMHSAEAALANYRAGREVFDTNGDVW
jgi:hypothetical protein